MAEGKKVSIMPQTTSAELTGKENIPIQTGVENKKITVEELLKEPNEKLRTLEESLGNIPAGTKVTIGPNGNWFLDGVDSGVKAKGEKGDSGVQLGQAALVDDLTTGGRDKVLTAEQGKILNEHISNIDQAVFIGTTSEPTIPNFTIIKGFVPTKGGAISTSDSYGHTSPIYVEKGLVVTISYKGWGMSPLSSTDAEGKTYHPIIRDEEVGNNSLKTIRYIAKDNMYISACGRTTDSSISVSLASIVVESISQKTDRIDEDNAALSRNLKYVESAMEGDGTVNLSDYPLSGLWASPDKQIWIKLNGYNGRIIDRSEVSVTDIYSNATQNTMIAYTDDKIVVNGTVKGTDIINIPRNTLYKLSKKSRYLWVSTLAANKDCSPMSISGLKVLKDSDIIDTPSSDKKKIVSSSYIKRMDDILSRLTSDKYDIIKGDRTLSYIDVQPIGITQVNYQSYEIDVNENDFVTFRYRPIAGIIMVNMTGGKSYPLLADIVDENEYKTYTYHHIGSAATLRLCHVDKESIMINGEKTTIKELGNTYAYINANIVGSQSYSYLTKKVKKGDTITVWNPSSGVVTIAAKKSDGSLRAILGYPADWNTPSEIKWTANGDAELLLCGDNNTIFLTERENQSQGNNAAIQNYDIKEIKLGYAEKTDILSLARNYILKEKQEGDGITYFYFSNDCGITYKKTKNTLGNITFVHFFSNGTVLLCTKQKCYYTSDFATFNETKVYDSNGSTFVPTSNHFYRLGNYMSPYRELGGKEVVIWNDYNIDPQWHSRVWLSDDFGKTLRCVMEAHVTTDDTGQPIVVRHFHRTEIDDSGCIWVTSGDNDAECKLLKGSYQDGRVSWHVVGASAAYKLGQINVGKVYATFITDYTDHKRDTGIIQCPIKSLSDASKFKYLWKTADKRPVSALYEDAQGNRCLFPDGSGYHTFWYARKDLNFKKINIVTDDPNWSPMCHIGPNYNGESIVYAIPGYNVANLSMSELGRYFFSEGMHKAGIVDFGMPKHINQ